jgi:hypothetical protein
MPDIMFSIIDIMLGGGWMSKYTRPIFAVCARHRAERLPEVQKQST